MLSKLKVAKLLILISFVFACYQVYIQIFYYEYPISDVLFLGPIHDKYTYFKGKSIGNHIFGDLYATIIQSKSNNPYSTNPNIYLSNYPPFTHILLLPFLKLNYLTQLAIFQIGTLLSVLAITYLFLREKDFFIQLENFLIFGFCFYPTQFLYDRGNLESLAFLFTGLFIYTVKKNKFLPAAICLGTAAAIKITPFILGIILLFKRKWKASLIAFIVFSGLCYVSFEYYKAFDIHVFTDFLSSMRNYSNKSVLGDKAIRANSSFYVLFKTAPLIFPNSHLIAEISHFLANKGYVAFFLILYLFSLIICFLNPNMKFWEVATLAFFLLIISPPSSFDYRLIHLLIPFFLIIHDSTENSRWSWFFTILFIAIFWPKNLFLIGKDKIGYGSFLNPLLMLLGILLINVKYLFLNLKSIFLHECPSAQFTFESPSLKIKDRN